MNHAVEENGRFYFEKEYHFCFLIYHIAKHLCSTGAGVRMFLDILIFLNHYGDDFDWDKANQLLTESSLKQAANAVFSLCDRWFGSHLSGATSIPEEVLDELEEYIIYGGVYGFETHDIGDIYKRKSYTEKNGRPGQMYLFRLYGGYFFPPAEYMIRYIPSLKNHKWLLPAAWVKRWWIGAFKRRKGSLKTIKVMSRKDDERSYREFCMLKKIGL